MNLNTLLLGVVVGAAPLTAQVFPSVPLARTFDVFLAERALEDVYRLRDLNQDGDYADPDESIVFFTNGTSGIVLASTTGITCGPGGTVYAVTSTSDVIAAFRDLNGDGDANDAAEAVIWFSSAGNAGGIQLGSAQSITVDQVGRVFVLCANSGSPAVGIDGVLQIEDVNADGDAQEAGEASYYLQVPGGAGPAGNSNPTEFAFGPDGALYYGEISGGTTPPIARGIYRAMDNDFDGDCNDPGEVTLWWVPPFSGVPSWYGMAFDPTGYLYLCNHGTGGRTIHRAFDLDANGTIDPAEQQLFHSGATSGAWWDLIRRDDGVLLMIDGTGNDVLALQDLTADDDFLDPGEMAIVFDDATTFPAIDPRAMAFMRAPSLLMAPSPVAIGNPTNWVMQTAEPFDLAIALAAMSIVPPISLPPYGSLEIDPSSLILFGIAVSDVSAQALFSLPLANDPALIGSYGCQAWCGELSRMFLSNASPLVVTP